MSGFIKVLSDAPRRWSRAKRQQSELIGSLYRLRSSHVIRVDSLTTRQVRRLCHAPRTAPTAFRDHPLYRLRWRPITGKEGHRGVEGKVSHSSLYKRDENDTKMRLRSRAENLARAQSLESQGRKREARDCYAKCLDITPEMAYQLIKVSFHSIKKVRSS